MKDECLICGAPLEYLNSAVEMECSICGKKEQSTARCTKGHYVCDACHTKGIDKIIGLCLSETSKDPVVIVRKLMAMDFCHMHGPEHHIMVGSALLTAYKNAGGKLDLPAALKEMQNRGKNVPGGTCGFWGACGAAISSGIFVSIATGATPLANKEWSLANGMTSASLSAVSKVGGPRCCKRNSYLAITEAVKYARENLGVEMELGDITCTHTSMNNQCIGARCPFIKSNKK